MSAFIITRIQVGDYDAWRPMFDQDRPLAREKATAQRIFRKANDPNHVFIFLEFASLTDAEEAARRLVESGKRYAAQLARDATAGSRQTLLVVQGGSPESRCARRA